MDFIWASIWRFPLRCSFRGFSDHWFLIIHNKSISYPKVTKYISINSIFSLVSKYLIFVIFWVRLVLWFCRTHTIDQSECFDFDFWLFSVKSEISILKTFYLPYLYHFHVSHLIFSYLKLLLNLSLTKSTLRLKSTLLSVDRPDTYPILDYYILSLWVRFYKFFLTIVFCFNDAQKWHVNDPSPSPIRDTFPDEHIIAVQVRSMPWYAHIVNYLATGKIPIDWDYNERKRFLNCYHITIGRNPNCSS